MDRGLVEVDSALKPHQRRLYLLDLFRSSETQRRLFAYILNSLLGDRNPAEMSVLDFVRLGIQADDIGSYAALALDDEYNRALEASKSQAGWAEVEVAAQELKISVDEVATLYMTFTRNIEGNTLNLDVTSNNAHGGGGAADAITMHTDTEEPCFLGVPFDYVSPLPDLAKPAAMTFFENEDNISRYGELVHKDPVLRTYLNQFGYDRNTLGVFREAQRERRILYHTMARAGFTIFNGECWHWNGGNERGGRQFDQLPYAGSPCHSLLRGVCTLTSEPLAVWGNEYAQRTVAEMLAIDIVSR